MLRSPTALKSCFMSSETPTLSTLFSGSQLL